MSQALPPAMQALVERLLAFLAQDGCDDAQFDTMAREVFAFQHAHSEPLQRFCRQRGIAPRRIGSWREIPAVPIGAFKEATLSCIPPQECAGIFMTSGTTRGEVRGRNHHPTFAVWDLSMRRPFAQRFMQGVERMPMVVLFPDAAQLPNSSLARYLAQAVRLHGTPGSRSVVGPAGMDVDAVVQALESAQRTGTPLALLGASFSLVHLLDALAARGLRYALPAGSRILDTGGFKGQSRELAPEAFYAQLAATFGVPRALCINMYGMTELSSQCYDAGNAVLPAPKSGPHWLRTRVLDPLTGRELPTGQPGLLAHTDLANFNSACTILTEDVGVATADGFVLLGRAEGAQARGCSLAVQEFLQAAR
jgi:acyl-CoA synthetase (AMP-forming)/AMP-acid ligase II